MQVAVTSSKGRVKRFRVKSKYKRLVMSTRYNKSPYTARVMTHNSHLRWRTVRNVCCIIRREVHKLCSTKHGECILRNTSSAAVTSFSWMPVVTELRTRAPVLYAVIKAIIAKQQKTTVHPSTIGTGAAVMLKCRNTFLAQAQTLISVLLYAGHCSKQVRVRIRDAISANVYTVA